MKNYKTFLVPATLLMMTLVPALPAFASSNTDSDDTGPSCSPITGNPFQEKCGETKTHSNPSGNVICAPEDNETHTPNFCGLQVN